MPPERAAAIRWAGCCSNLTNCPFRITPSSKFCAYQICPAVSLAIWQVVPPGRRAQPDCVSTQRNPSAPCATPTTLLSGNPSSDCHARENHSVLVETAQATVVSIREMATQQIKNL